MTKISVILRRCLLFELCCQRKAWFVLLVRLSTITNYLSSAKETFSKPTTGAVVVVIE